MKTESIVQDLDDNRCFLCGSRRNLELHHIMHGSANRRLSTKWNLVCWLCAEHHRGRFGVHQNAQLDEKLKQVGQKAFEDIHSRELWMKLFKKNYL